MEQDRKGSMKKASRNVEIDPDKFALLRSPERQILLATAGCLMRLILKPSFEFPGSTIGNELIPCDPRDRTWIKEILQKCGRSDPR